MRRLQRLVCWWRAIYHGQWGEIYGGHLVNEVEHVSATGAVFHRVECEVCGMFFGLAR